MQNLLTDLAIGVFFYGAIALNIKFARFCAVKICLMRRARKQKLLSEQVEFLKKASYQALSRKAKELGLIAGKIKKTELCYILAAYQLD